MELNDKHKESTTLSASGLWMKILVCCCSSIQIGENKLHSGLFLRY